MVVTGLAIGWRPESFWGFVQGYLLLLLFVWAFFLVDGHVGFGGSAPGGDEFGDVYYVVSVDFFVECFCAAGDDAYAVAGFC